MSIVGILTDPGIGGTFLDWTIHYLAGHTQVYHTASNSWHTLPKNPLTETNSHNFKPNQPANITEFRDIVKKLTALSNTDPQTIYFHTLSDNNLTPNLEQYKIDTETAITECTQHTNKIIRVALTKHQALYLSSYNYRWLGTRWNSSTERYKSNQERHQDFITTFFKESEQQWAEQNLTSTWDHREFLALNIDPFNILYFRDMHNFDFDFFDLDCVDCWTTLDLSINTLFDYLELSVDKTRLASWETTYNAWKQLHHQRIQFMMYYDNIVDNIVNNGQMDLTRFNLDIVQEAAIQHALIYQYNLNLKTWQLEKFLDTKQLHSLLEPNTHLLNK